MSIFEPNSLLDDFLHSLKQQTFKDFIIVYRSDDGEDYKGILSDFKSYRCNCLENSHLGANESYKHLLTHSEPFEYIFFADQDDIWFPNKIEDSLKSFKSPQIDTFFSTVVRTDTNETFPKMPPNNIIHAIFQNFGMGCTSCFKNSSKITDWVVNSPKSIMFDHALYIYASINRSLMFSRTPTMLYRIHNNNDTGIRIKHFVPHIIKNPQSLIEYLKRTSDCIKHLDSSNGFKVEEVKNLRRQIRLSLFLKNSALRGKRSESFLVSLFAFLGLFN